MPCSLATSAVTCVDSYGSSSSSFGIEEVLLLQDRVQLAEGLEDRRLGREVEVAVLGEQALEHELVRGAAAQADVACPCNGRSCRTSGRTPRTGACRRTWSANRRRWRFHRSCGRQRAWSWADSRRGRRGAAKRHAARGETDNYTVRARRAREPRPAPEASRAGGSAQDSSARWPTPRIRPTEAGAAEPFGRRLVEEAPRGEQRGQRIVAAAARRRVCLDSFSPVASIATGTCRYDGVGKPRQLLQEDLARRRREQVGAAHDVRDALQRVVDDDRELVGEEPVGAPDDEIADVAREVLRLRSLQAVAEFDRARRRRARARRAAGGRAGPAGCRRGRCPG